MLSKREKTDDAYVTGNQVRISSQLAGTVVEVFVRNTSRVDGRPGAAATRPHRCAAGARPRRGRAGPDGAPGAVSSRHSPPVRCHYHRAQAGTASRRAGSGATRAAAGRSGRGRRGSAPRARCRGPGAGPARRRREQQARCRPRTGGSMCRWWTTRPCSLRPRRYRDAWLALQRTRIVAPIDGYIAQRSVQLGPAHRAWRAADDHHPAAGRVARGQLQGRPAAPPAHRAAGPHRHRRVRRRRRIPWPGDRAVRPAPAPPSRCCRRRTPRATGSRWCSACR